MNLREMFGLVQQHGDVGVESEVEAVGRLPASPAGWDVHAEDSLRGGNGIEYVTRGAVSVLDLKAVLDRLYSQLRKPEVRVRQDSVSTSTHVHLNMQEHTATQYWNTVVALWILDPLLMKYCGPDREHNNFCLRFQDSQGIVKNALYDLRKEAPFLFLNNDRVKYGSVNMGNARTKGTVEHRGMRCSIDTDFVYDWCMNLHEIKHQAVQFRDPANLMDYVYQSKPIEVLRRFLRPDLIVELQKYPNWEQMLVTNVGALCELCYTHDWGKWQARLDKRKLKEAAKKQPIVLQREAFDHENVPPAQENPNAFLRRMQAIVAEARDRNPR